MRALANCLANSADDASRVCQSLSENDCATAKQNGLHWDIELTFDAAMQWLDSNHDSPECAGEWRLRAPRTAPRTCRSSLRIAAIHRPPQLPTQARKDMRLFIIGGGSSAFNVVLCGRFLHRCDYVNSIV
jgi:hypothetical protein